MPKRKIVFVIDHISMYEVFSIPILSALAKENGHSVKLIEFRRNAKAALREIKAFAPEIVCYSICSNEAKNYFEINRIIKKEIKCFSIFGGPHPTFLPSMVKLEDIDGICKGEGDISFPKFLKYFGTDKMYDVENFSFKVGPNIKENSLAKLVDDLDSLPFPDRELLYSKNKFLSKSPIKAFFAGRGCPFKCSYCFNHAYNLMYKKKGKILRTKTVSYLFNEIKSVSKKYPLHFIKFHDDIFGANTNWLNEFAERYPAEISLPFVCYTRPNMVNENYAKMLQKSGCYSVCLAIESGNEEIRKRVLHRNVTDGQIRNACEVLKKHKLRIYTLNMLGLPEETEKEMFQTLKINQENKIDFADASIFQPYPGTIIAEYCQKKGYLFEEKERYESQYSNSILNFDSEYKRKIKTLHRLFPLLVDFPRLVFFYNLFVKNDKFGFTLNIFYRFYYGFFLHRRIFASKIPLFLRISNAFNLIFSQSRS